MIEVREFMSDRTSVGYRAQTTTLIDGVAQVPTYFDVTGVEGYDPPKDGNAFLLPALLLALKYEKDLLFRVPVSETLAAKIDDAAYVISKLLGVNHRPTIEFTDFIADRPKALGFVTGFSAGIDSFQTLHAHYFNERFQSRKITHLICNNVGANSTSEKIHQVASKARNYAAKQGFGYIEVNSNLTEYLDMDFAKTHTARNASAVHMLTPVVGGYYYSSSTPYEEIEVQPGPLMCKADPVLLPLFSTPEMEMLVSGGRYNRIKKTEMVAQLDDPQTMLDVCVNHHHSNHKTNCSMCYKCMRTAIALDCLGQLERFSEVFDLDVYRKSLKGYLAGASSGTSLEKDVLKLARDVGLSGSSRWKLLPYKIAQKTGLRTFRNKFLPKGKI